MVSFLKESTLVKFTATSFLLTLNNQKPLSSPPRKYVFRVLHVSKKGEDSNIDYSNINGFGGFRKLGYD